MDADREEPERVVEGLAGDLGDAVGVDLLVDAVGVAGADRLQLGRVADAEGVAPLLLVHELADVVEIAEPHPGQHPLRRPVLELGLGRHEERQDRVGEEHDGGDPLPAQRTYQVLRCRVGEAAEVERVAAHVRDRDATGLGQAPELAGAFGVDGVVGVDDGDPPGLALQVAARVEGVRA